MKLSLPVFAALMFSAMSVSADQHQASTADITHHDHKGETAHHTSEKTIDYDEYMEKAATRFMRMDADSDGVLTAEERKAARKAFKSHQQHKREKHSHAPWREGERPVVIKPSD